MEMPWPCRLLGAGLELQDAPQPLAVGLVTATAPLPGMPSYAPMPLDGVDEGLRGGLA